MSSSGIFIDRGLINSAAFKELSKSAVHVYLIFRTKCQVKKRKGSRGTFWEVLNSGNILFTYREAEKKYGMVPSTFKRAIDALVKYGFIYIEHSGNGCQRDASTYGMSDQWKNYGTDRFTVTLREKDSRGIGFTKNNWEEKTGRSRCSSTIDNDSGENKKSYRKG